MILTVAGTAAAILYLSLGLGLILGFARAARENDRLLDEYEPAGSDPPPPSPDASGAVPETGRSSAELRVPICAETGISGFPRTGERAQDLSAHCP
jgi:hypothetical protein